MIFANFSFSDFSQEVKRLIVIAFPILIAQLAVAGLGVVDTIMSGRVGTEDLAAIGLGSSILFPVMILALGILMPLTPIVAKIDAKGEQQSLALHLSQGLWLALPIGMLMWFLLTSADYVLGYLPLTPKVFHLTDDYLDYIAWGLPGLGLYFVYRFFWEGLSLTLPTMIISLAALILNIPLNAIFIYGWGSIPAYGAAGCGIASTLVMWGMLLAGMWYIYFKLNQQQAGLNLRLLHKPKWIGGIKPLLALGIPNTLAQLFEVSLFSLIALLIAQLGTVVIAAHQVTLSFSSLIFMVPLSISLAVAIRSGQALGKGSRQELVTKAYSAIIFSALVGLLTMVLTLAFRHEIISLYNENPQVIQLTSVLLVIAALYQVFDAIQVTTAGALRGLHSTQVTMWVTLVSYWGVGLGGGYMLTFGSPWNEPLGVAGFWIGILLGLVFAAIALQLKLVHLIRKLERRGELV